MHQLVPDQDSAEGRRERLDREHPVLSRWMGFFSLLLLLVPALRLRYSWLDSVAQG